MLNVDKPPYGTVIVSGAVRSDGQSARGVPVAVQLTGAAGELLAADQVVTDAQGAFTCQLAPPTGTSSGRASLVVAAAGAVERQSLDIPLLPAAYYGSVKDANGQSLASGKVEAYIEGRKAGELEFTNGFYGGAGGLEPKLVVSGTEADRGKAVTFKVIAGGQTLVATPSPAVVWQPGDVRRVDLTVVAPPPGGGAGGGVAPPPPADKVEKPVQAGAATVAELPGKVKVEVPVGAVAGANARLLLAVLPESEAAPILGKAKDVHPASPVVDVSVKDGQVSGSITVVLFYDLAKVPAGGVPAAYFYSDRKACWVYLGGKVDRDSKTVSVEVSHLTRFAVFARDPVPAFSDMQGHWAEQVVARLAGMGVVSGYPGNVFKPGAEISRVECTAILVRALGLPAAGEDELGRFKDAADIPSWARGLIAAAVKEGLVKGYPEQDGGVTFRAGNPVTRGELATLVARIMVKEVGPVTGTVSQFADRDKIPDWAKESVGAAAAKGIIKGYEDGTFRAQNNVTRSEAAAMILRLLDVVYAP